MNEKNILKLPAYPVTQKNTLISRTQAFNLVITRMWWSVELYLPHVLKRTKDILLAGTLMLMLAPFFLLIALLIRLDSPGPLLFKQVRVGRFGKTFTMWKFRSMYIDAEARKAQLESQNESQAGVLFKMKRDPRITRVGRFIRKASIDELPQLWNVLKGEMSLVGPRPALTKEVEQYTLEDRRRLEAMPGITCLWQVSGRSDIPFDGQVKLDIEYIHKQSLGKDIEILFRTIPAVLLARGAY